MNQQDGLSVLGTCHLMGHRGGCSRWAGRGLGETGLVRRDPEAFLRGLAQSSLLAIRHSPGLLLTTSSQLQAVANMFVLLDLLAESDAEAVLAEHLAALETLGVTLQGVKSGELTLRSTSAYRFGQVRHQPTALLRDRPILVAQDIRLSFAAVEVQIEWLVVAPSGLRGQAMITARDGAGLPATQLEVVVPAVDDAGRAFRLTIRGGTPGVTTTPPTWSGLAAAQAEISTDPALPPETRWIEIRPPGSAARRVDFVVTRPLPSGRSDLEWPTPAEWLLDSILPDVCSLKLDAQFGVGLDASEAVAVVGAVTDVLLAVGALPAGSRLLHQLPTRQSSWLHELRRRYTHRARQELATNSQERQVVAVGSSFPLEQGVAAIDAMIVQDGNVYMRLYVFPDAVGEYWPVSVRRFDLSCTDQGIPATHWRTREGEGLGDLWLWPPLDPAVRRLRLEITTPWEAAWTDVDIPTPRPARAAQRRKVTPGRKSDGKPTVQIIRGNCSEGCRAERAIIRHRARDS